MYKVHINRWGLDKKLKECEVIELVRMRQQRDAMHKKSRFIIRGKVIRWGQVEKYLSRRPDLQAKISTGRLAPSNSKVDVAYRTPSPDLMEVSPVPPFLTGAIEVRLPEEIGRLTKGLVDGRLEAGHAALSFGYDSGLWNEEMSIALRHIRGQSAADAIRLINVLLGRLNALAREQGISLVFNLVGVAGIFRREWPDVSNIVNNYIGQLLQILMGPRHPVVLIWSRYTKLPQSEVFFSFVTAAKYAFEHVESRLGRTSFYSIEALHIYLAVLSVGVSGKMGEARDFAPKLTMGTLEAVETSHYPPTLQVMALDVRCAAQIRMGYYHAAEQTLALIEPMLHTDVRTFMRIRHCGMLSDVLENTGRVEQAGSLRVTAALLSQAATEATDAMNSYGGIHRRNRIYVQALPVDGISRGS